jgi:hypothetical protein
MYASIGMKTYAVLFFGTLFSCQGAQSRPVTQLKPSGGRLAIVRIGLVPKVPLSLRCSRTRLLLRQQHATARRGSGRVTLVAVSG